MALAQEKPSYTYKDYLSWNENERVELLEGQPIMQAAPSRKHQYISGELFFQLRTYLEGKDCQVYHAPFCVRLFESEYSNTEDQDTIVEPDIVVVCDKNKLDDRGCKGAPDFIIEILSPATARYDLLLKLNKYQQAGVKEYWIVDPANETVQVYLLKGNKLELSNVYSSGDIVKVTVLQSCFIETAKLFKGC